MSIENRIYNFFREKGCCKRCSLRYLDDRNIDFNNVDQYIEKENLQDPSMPESNNQTNSEDDLLIKRSKSNPCIVCLGLLEEYVLEDTINRVSVSEMEKYDTNVFTCSISIPAATLIREYAMRACLKDSFPEFYERDIEELHLNKIWKLVIKERLVKKLNLAFENSSTCNFSINIIMDYEDNEKELDILKELLPKQIKKDPRSYGRKFVSNALSSCSSETFTKHLETIFTVPVKAVTFSQIEFKHNSIYIAGRYKKYSRELSQTPWIIDGVKMMEMSVEEIIFKQLNNLFGVPTAFLKFSASGREDCDVRCLGKGRPFYIEILDPKKTKYTFDEFRKLELAVNSSPMISVKDLQMVFRKDLVNIKEGEELKTKEYIALCQTRTPITEEQISTINCMSEITLKQKTPIRVLHRRPLAVREKTIYKLKAKLVPGKENVFILYAVTQAGTYVKEFVHGDFGRTIPNLGEIISTEVDIIALDVIAINLDWPEEIINVKDN